jgi:autotransporter-associated beta strand protein
LDYEGSTGGLGDPNGTLTVETGATFEMFGSSSALTKNIVLNGSGTNDTLLAGSGVANTIGGPVTVNGACIFDAVSGSALIFNSNLSGNGSVNKIGPGTNIISGGFSASYTGGTTVSNGTLMVDGSLSGTVLVTTNGALAGSGTASGAVSVLSGSLVPGDSAAGLPQTTLTLGNLAISNATAVLELSTSPSSGNDVIAAGNLTVNGTNTLQIAPLSFLNVGDTYTVITYTGATLPSGATNQLKVTSTRNFFSFAVVDPSTTPGQIQVKVLSAVGNDLWTGAQSTNWDNTTTNWTRNGVPVAFNDGDFVTFDDSSSVTNINISGVRTISGITEQSGSKIYTFTGTGSLTGPGGVDLEGIYLKIDNSGTNDFTGPMFINFGILQVGTGSTNGNLGSGIITNNGSLVFNRSDTNTVANAITGSGAVTNVGTGMVSLSGANSFTGETVIQHGILRALSSTALGTVFTGTTVSNTATLDITNNVNLGREPITASGAGVNGNGAIVNSSGSSTFVGPNFALLTLAGNTVIGGSGRLDFRSSSATAADAQLTTTGGSPSLTKLGTNLLQLGAVQIDSALGDILVGAGTLGFQWQTPSLGDPARTLSVSNGASLAFFDMSNAVSKVLILNNGSSVLGQHGTNFNEFDGPVTLNGSNTFNISSGTFLLFANSLGGTGNLIKTGPGNLILSLAQAGAGTETYSGSTFVSQGTLTLLDNAALGNSATIVLSNSTLSVTGRVDSTLTVGAVGAQKLAGGGVIDGTLIENSGSTVTPGNGVIPAVLTVSNAATLNGNVVMDLNTATAVINDKIVAPSITVGGPLTVANIGPDLQTGNTFQLFSVPVTVASVTLPLSNTAGNKTYQWRNDLAVNGSIVLTNVVVTGGPTTNANITKVTLSGGNLLIHGTNNNVPNNTGHYVVLTSTNLALPLSSWTPVVTNTFNNDGTFDYSAPVVPGVSKEFIDVQAVQ